MKPRIALLTVAILTLTACANTADVSTATTPATPTTTETATAQTAGSGGVAIEAPMPEIPAGLEQFYEQNLTWGECGEHECADLTVPVDYENPDGGTITIRLKKGSANGEPIGSLLVNPGGPGASGQDMVDLADYYFSDDLQESFDIIGFDPRGVGESAPVDCLDDAQLGEYLDTSYPDTPEGDAAEMAAMDAVVEGCKTNTGEHLEFVGTRESAQDMDVIRHVLGDPRLYYVGYSYGTTLGGMYAELFPQNVGRMILDGAVDDSIPAFDQTLAQAKGFEQAFDAYAENCVSSGECVLGSSVAEARATVAKLFEDLGENPMQVGDRQLSQTGLFYGIAMPLYDDTAWVVLDKGFEALINDKSGDVMLLLYDTYFQRQGDSFASNLVEANWAINCADTWVQGDRDEWEKLSEQMAEEAPLFGPVMGYSQYMCEVMPGGEDGPLGPFVAAGSEPIVVVGTTGDPATPYEWSEAFADTMENSVFVTWEGEGHTAYGRAGECINKPLDAYLLRGEVPDDGLTCVGDE